MVLGELTAPVLAGTATVVCGVGGVCWIVCPACRLTAVRWAAERAVASGRVPDASAASEWRAATLFLVQMLTAHLGPAVLAIAAASRGTKAGGR